MPMAKADFEAVAAVIYNLKEETNSREDVAYALADALVSQSNSMDPVLFMETCGFDSEDVPDRLSRYSRRLALRINSLDYR